MDTQLDITEAALPSHTGLYRQETSLLRELFGFAKGDVSTTVNQLGDIEFGEGLSSTSIKDVVFIAIDVDTLQGFEEIVPDQQLHLGVSILSTRALRDLILAPSAAESAKVIRSYQFTAGGSKYCRRASRKFLFGESDSIPLSNIKPRVEKIIPSGDIITVFHGAQCDAKALHLLDIDLHPVCVIDTVKAAQHPLQLHHRLSLENLLKELAIPNTNLHAAGNDAHFTLCALLMLVVIDAERQGVPSKESLFRALRGVAQAPCPPTRQEIEKVERSARLRVKRESKLRRKARRSARTERRKLERERQLAASEEGHSSDTESGVDAVE
ncbi:putative Qde-2-interacting protein [Seiridium cardinale]|uniref:Qde-2-interacting protein n=1 Tax=Seiridium cardinale TaxID=138064 RepID=A0ABR2X6L0_9PEZI